MVRRKVGITTLSIFKLYHKVLATYEEVEYAMFLAYKAKKINDKRVERAIQSFLSNHLTESFNNSLVKIEKYFSYCFENNKNLYFFNLGAFVEEWKKFNASGNRISTKFLFFNTICTYLKDNNISIEEYIKKRKNYIPVILQHYIATKNIPFELLITLKILEKCDIDKNKLKMLIKNEIYNMDTYIQNEKKLHNTLIQEFSKVLKWEEQFNVKTNNMC